MTVVDVAHHAGHHHKTPGHHCGLAIWCHVPAAQARHDVTTAHLALAVLILVLVLAVVITIVRRRRKSSRRSTQRPAYPPSYGGR